MALLSLRESLAHSKDKWKKLLNISSDSTSSAQHPSNPGTTSNNFPSTDKVTWPAIKTLLSTLESSADMLGPLKAAISGLGRCVDIYEVYISSAAGFAHLISGKSVSGGHREYVELRRKLEGLLDDLAMHTSSMDFVMTNSVKRLCAGIEDELRNVEKIKERNTGRQLIDAMAASDEILECYRRIHGHLERLTLNTIMDIVKANNKKATETQLASISPIKSSMYNSAESDDIKRGGCMPGTRQAQINLLLEWARTPEAGRTCWMSGMAGTGKTTIAYSVCNELDKTSGLGASFFCSRVIPECRQVKHIIPSIAYQLARFSLPFRCALVKILESDPDAHSRALAIQYQKLIVDPLLEVQSSLPTDLTVVIDALDECENEDSVSQILDLFLSSTHRLPIRYLVSSRPETEIHQRMMGRAEGQGDALLVLHDLDSESVGSDIETYMKHELALIPLTDAQWSGIIERCGVLFIYASTTCRYIQQGYNTDTLDEVVGNLVGSASAVKGHRDEHAIDGLYLTVLTSAFKKYGMSQDHKARMKTILETVICAVEPMSLNALASLLGLRSTKQADAFLQPLRSVLNVSETTGLVTTLHASFSDFMFARSRSMSFCCTRASRHAVLAEACLHMIDRVEPKFNVCGLPSSYLLDNEVEHLDKLVNRAISPGLSYACRYWSTHLHFGEYRDELKDLVRHFFFGRLLLWMEVLNLTQNLRHGTSIIQNAERWCTEQTAPKDVIKIAHDAWQFVSMYANHPVSKSTPHIYMSMLPFWPQSRPIAKVYMPRTVGMVQPTGTAIARRQLTLLATWSISSSEVYGIGLSIDGTRLAAVTNGNVDVFDSSTGDNVLNITDKRLVHIHRITISPDGMRIAFKSSDHDTFYLCDIGNGGKITEPSSEQKSPVWSSAFSPDGSHFAFGLDNGDIGIYSFQRGLVLGPFKGHSTRVSSISFSPDGLYLASGSYDNTICIWDITAGHMVGESLKGHTDSINSLSYSPNGSRLASASSDKTIRVWDPQTGETVLGPLKGHSDIVNSVAFSRNGSFIASGSDDRTIRVYDAPTGQTILGPLEGHTDWVKSVIFSPVSAQLFSCSGDGTIRVWNVQDLDVHNDSPPPPPITSPIFSVRYSHSGLRVVSGSLNGTVHIWDVQTGEMLLGPLYGHAGQISSVDYSPNDAYIASASHDTTLRLWDVSIGKDLHGPLHGHTNGVSCVRFSPNSSVVASGAWDSTVRIWDVTNGQLVKLIAMDKNKVVSVGFSPNGDQIVSGLHSEAIRVSNLHTDETLVGLSTSKDHRGAVCSVEFSPDGLCVLSCSRDGSIQLWDARTGQEMLDCRMFSREWRNQTVGFSPDGLYIVAGSGGGAIYVWDVQSGNLILGPLKGHTASIDYVQFSPDGLHVVSCSVGDRTIRFWDVSSCGERIGIRDSAEREEDAPSASCNNPPDFWSVDENGWVVGSQDQRLLWVPSDLQTYLACPLNDLIIADAGWFTLNFDGVNIGEMWGDCYRP